MQFMLRFDGSEIDNQLRKILEGAKALLKDTQKMFSIPAKTAGQAVLDMQQPFIGTIVDEYERRGGERAEVACAEYWWMMALACGMTGRLGEGQQYIRKAQSRKGGVFHEWCQTFYKSSL